MKKIIKEHFKSNFLDGQELNDCGGCTFTVSGAIDIAEYFYELGIEKGTLNTLKSNIELASPVKITEYIKVPKILLDEIRKKQRDEIVIEIEKAYEQFHGGGNSRRLFLQLIDKIKELQ